MASRSCDEGFNPFPQSTAIAQRHTATLERRKRALGTGAAIERQAWEPILGVENNCDEPHHAGADPWVVSGSKSREPRTQGWGLWSIVLTSLDEQIVNVLCMGRRRDLSATKRPPSFVTFGPAVIVTTMTITNC
jgi:hypothetical protein